MLIWILITFSTIASLSFHRTLASSTSSLSSIAETLIHNGSLITDMFDGLELGTVIGRQGSVTLSYLINQPQRFWLTVTPCTNAMAMIKFRAALTARQPSPHLLGKKRQFKNKQQQFTMHPIGLSNDMKDVKYGLRWLSGSKRSRVNFEGLQFPGDTLHVDIFSSPGAIFKVRLSTRFSLHYIPKAYPQLPSTSSSSYPVSVSHPIEVCQNSLITKPHLHVSWRPALNQNEHTLYCVAVNDREDFPEQCSAAARISSSTNPFLYRSAVFSNSDSIRQSPQIKKFVYECTRATELRVNLSDQLMKSPTGGRLYVNVYAINELAGVSTGYTGHVLSSPPPPCRVLSAIPLTLVLSTHQHLMAQTNPYQQTLTGPLYWKNDAKIEWRQQGESGPDEDHTLFIRSCRHPLSKENSYRVQVFQQLKDPQKKHEEKEICSRDVNSISSHFESTLSPIIEICKLEGSAGSIRIHTSPKVKNGQSPNAFLPGQQIARLLFVSPKSIEKLLPIVPGYSPIYGRRRFRSTRIEKNYFFSGDCQHHQVNLNLTINAKPHSYWVYTIPLNMTITDLHNATFMKKIQNKVNHCTFSDHSFYDVLANGKQVAVNHFTKANKTQARLPLPIFDKMGEPRFYLVLLYAARQLDFAGNYRSLIVDQVVDACNVVTADCYAYPHGSECPQ